MPAGTPHDLRRPHQTLDQGKTCRRRHDVVVRGDGNQDRHIETPYPRRSAENRPAPVLQTIASNVIHKIEQQRTRDGRLLPHPPRQRPRHRPPLLIAPTPPRLPRRAQRHRTQPMKALPHQRRRHKPAPIKREHRHQPPRPQNATQPARRRSIYKRRNRSQRRQPAIPKRRMRSDRQRPAQAVPDQMHLSSPAMLPNRLLGRQQRLGIDIKSMPRLRRPWHPPIEQVHITTPADQRPDEASPWREIQHPRPRDQRMHHQHRRPRPTRIVPHHHPPRTPHDRRISHRHRSPMQPRRHLNHMSPPRHRGQSPHYPTPNPPPHPHNPVAPQQAPLSRTQTRHHQTHQCPTLVRRRAAPRRDRRTGPHRFRTARSSPGNGRPRMVGKSGFKSRPGRNTLAGWHHSHRRTGCDWPERWTRPGFACSA